MEHPHPSPGKCVALSLLLKLLGPNSQDGDDSTPSGAGIYKEMECLIHGEPSVNDSGIISFL